MHVCVCLQSFPQVSRKSNKGNEKNHRSSFSSGPDPALMRAPIRGAKKTVAFSSSSLDIIYLEVSNIRSLCPELPIISIKPTYSTRASSTSIFFFFKERCDITVLVFNPSPLTVPPASWDWSTVFCAGFTTGNQPEKHPPFQS